MVINIMRVAFCLCSKSERSSGPALLRHPERNLKDLMVIMGIVVALMVTGSLLVMCWDLLVSYVSDRNQ